MDSKKFIRVAALTFGTIALGGCNVIEEINEQNDAHIELAKLVNERIEIARQEGKKEGIESYKAELCKEEINNILVDKYILSVVKNPLVRQTIHSSRAHSQIGVKRFCPKEKAYTVLNMR